MLSEICGLDQSADWMSLGAFFLQDDQKQEQSVKLKG
jgi:hypothetical protein